VYFVLTGPALARADASGGFLLLIRSLEVLGGVNHLAVLLDEAADMGVGQNVEHRFRGPTEFDAFRRDDDRPVDQDRMRQHEIDQLVVAPLRIGKP
jgi:hypothetical protein